MIVPADVVRVVIANRSVDFRRSHDSLAALSRQASVKLKDIGDPGNAYNQAKEHDT
jgi:hypothetical protein